MTFFLYMLLLALAGSAQADVGDTVIKMRSSLAVSALGVSVDETLLVFASLSTRTAPGSVQVGRVRLWNITLWPVTGVPTSHNLLDLPYSDVFTGTGGAGSIKGNTGTHGFGFRSIAANANRWIVGGGCPGSEPSAFQSSIPVSPDAFTTVEGTFPRSSIANYSMRAVAVPVPNSALVPPFDPPTHVYSAVGGLEGLTTRFQDGWQGYFSTSSPGFGTVRPLGNYTDTPGGNRTGGIPFEILYSPLGGYSVVALVAYPTSLTNAYAFSSSGSLVKWEKPLAVSMSTPRGIADGEHVVVVGGAPGSLESLSATVPLERLRFDSGERDAAFPTSFTAPEPIRVLSVTRSSLTGLLYATGTRGSVVDPRSFVLALDPATGTLAQPFGFRAVENDAPMVLSVIRTANHYAWIGGSEPEGPNEGIVMQAQIAEAPTPSPTPSPTTSSASGWSLVVSATVLVAALAVQ